MQLIYSRIGEFTEFEINRTEKKLKLCGPETMFQQIEYPYSYLYDKWWGEIEINKLNNLSDKEFVDLITLQMKLYGFKLETCHY